jgi:hypothetical protein
VEVEILGTFPVDSPGPAGARDVGAGVVGVLSLWESVSRVEVAPQWWVPPPRLPLRVVVPMLVVLPCRVVVLQLVRLPWQALPKLPPFDGYGILCSSMLPVRGLPEGISPHPVGIL